MKTNELIELPEGDKLQITNTSLKISLDLLNSLGSEVHPTTLDSALKELETSLKRELSKERFKILRKDLEILELKEQIELLKRQIK